MSDANDASGWWIVVGTATKVKSNWIWEFDLFIYLFLYYELDR